MEGVRKREREKARERARAREREREREREVTFSKVRPSVMPLSNGTY